MASSSELEDAARALLSAADEITCCLHMPEAWELNWFDAKMLIEAADRVRELIK